MFKGIDFEKSPLFLLLLFFATAVGDDIYNNSVFDCKLERKCQPVLEQTNLMCMNYSLSKRYITNSTVAPQCSHWTVDTLIFYFDQTEILYLDDFILSEDKVIDVIYSTAIFIPALFYPTRSMVKWCYLYSASDIYSIYFTDAVNSSFTALYHIKWYPHRFFNLQTFHIPIFY